MTNYTEHFSTKTTPQSQSIPGKVMVKNNAGGFGFAISKWEMLDRFLILGTEGNTYYQREQEMVIDNAKNVIACIKEDGKKAVSRIVEISDAGRAPKNNPAIFALALATTFGDADTKTHAYKAITKVCRIGTHIFQFCQNIQDLRGWSRGLRSGVAQYLMSDRIAYDLVKYRQRDGWTHRDVLRLSHAPLKSAQQQVLAKWILGKEVDQKELPQLVQDYERMAKAESAKEVLKILQENKKLPWETIPTQFLKEASVWEALLPTLPLNAMTRNLGRMSSIGLFKSGLHFETNIVVNALTNKDLVKKSRIHPIAALTAMKIYEQGHGMKGNLTWDVNPRVKDALEEMFYIAFGNVESTGLGWLLALDVSGSMTIGTIGGSPIRPFEATAAMAMVTARSEKLYEVVGFTHTVQKLGITAKDTLSSAMQKTHKSDFGSTDAGAAIRWARQNNVPVDVFTVYTDNESWSGPVHVSQELEKYRHDTGRKAKLISVGMTATNFSVVDESDPGQMNVVGFDTGAVEAMRFFSTNNQQVIAQK